MYAFFTRDSFNRGYFGVTGIRLQKYVNVHTIVFRHGFDIALVRLRPLVWACSLELELSTIYPGPTWWTYFDDRQNYFRDVAGEPVNPPRPVAP